MLRTKSGYPLGEGGPGQLRWMDLEMLITSRMFTMAQYDDAMREHERIASITRKVRHPSLGLCIEVVYLIPQVDGGK